MQNVIAKAWESFRKKPKLWGMFALYFLMTIPGVLIGPILLGLFPFAGVVLMCLIGHSFRKLNLRAYRGEELCAYELFTELKNKEFILRYLMGNGEVLLWSLLFMLIPIAGPVIVFIKRYEWWLVPYILLEETEIKATDAIKESKRRMAGHKLNVFTTDLIFAAVPTAMFVIVWLISVLSYKISVKFGLFTSAVSIFLTIVIIVFSALILFPLRIHCQAAIYESIGVAPSRKVCPNCGTPITENGVFCTGCGTRLG